MKKKLLALLALILIPSLTFAYSFETGEEVLLNNPINNDLYSAGGLVQLTRDVQGDAYIAGGKVDIDANVQEDLVATGGDLTFIGDIGGDARIAGGNIRITANIDEDLFAAGGNIDILGDSTIGEDLTVASGTLTFNGVLEGNLKAATEAVIINGVINGSADISTAKDISFGPDAKINGDLTYSSAEEMESIPEGVVAGEVTYTEKEILLTEEEARKIGKGILAGISISRILSMLFAGLFLIWLLRFFDHNTVQIALNSTFKSLGVGFLFLVLTPIAAFIFLVSAVGMPLSAILVASYFILLYIGKLIAALIIGMKLIKVTEKDSFLRVYGAYALGVVIFVLISPIPYIGWILKLLLTLIGIGALILYELELYRMLHKKKMV